jgi:plastocyanin
MNCTRVASKVCALLLGLCITSAAIAAGGTITGTVSSTPAKYLANTVVYLKAVPGTYAPRSHELDQRAMSFTPRILTVTEGDTVKFLNHDGVAHNVYSPDGEGYNLGTFKQGESAAYTFKKAGVYTQLCSIHPEMLAYIFVGQNPYASTVDAKGHFAIHGVPPGTWTLATWNAEKLKSADKSVTVSDGKTIEESLAIKR